MLTSLYLTKVLPASTPPADLKMIVMVGPSLRIRWIAIPMATTAARIGMIQTTEIRWRRLGTTVARGRLSGLSAMVLHWHSNVLSYSLTVTLISFTTKIIARRSRNRISNHLPQRRKTAKKIVIRTWRSWRLGGRNLRV